jgi:hypothetical protein
MRGLLTFFFSAIVATGSAFAQQTISYADGANNTSPITITPSTNPTILTVGLGSSATQSGAIGESGTSGQIIVEGGGSPGGDSLGGGTLILNNANTYSGGTTVNTGTLDLDFSAATAPVNDIIANNTELTLGGGTLNVYGDSNTTNLSNSQTFSTLTVNVGASMVTVANDNNLTTDAIVFNSGTITRSAGGTIDFVSPANTSITLAGNSNNAFIGAYAFYGAAENETYAATSSIGVVQAAVGTVANGVNSFTSSTANYTYVSPSVLDTLQSAATANTAVFNSNSPQTIDLANNTLTLNGLLNANGPLTIQASGTGTLNIGASNELIIGGGNNPESLGNNGGGGDGGGVGIIRVGGGTVILNDIAAGGRQTSGSGTSTGYTTNGLTSGSTITISAPIVDNGANASSLTDSYGGILVLSGANTYSGGTTINSGYLEVAGDDNLGAASGGITLAGGELLTDYPAEFWIGGFTTSRAITIVNSGIIAAITTSAATYSGTISGGTLTIGDSSNDGVIEFSNTLIATGITNADGNGGTMVSINQNAYLYNEGTIAGGNGANGVAGAGGIGVSMITNSSSFGNDGSISGGAGGTGIGTGSTGGTGGTGVFVNTEYGSFSNGGSVTGGAGGDSIGGSGGGDIVTSGGTGGTAVLINNESGFSITGSITGGVGGSAEGIGTGGNGGTGLALSGGNYNDTGTVISQISGGNGGAGKSDINNAGFGGNGGTGAIFTGTVQALNEGTITGGLGGVSTGLGSNFGGTGGTGVEQDSYNLSNTGVITGGNGGEGSSGNGGDGGAAVLLSSSFLQNGGTVTGGTGGQGDLAPGGNGGIAVGGDSSSSLDNNVSITGGTGGEGVNGANGGNGGMAVANIGIYNMGTITGGQGGQGSANGGNGGVAVTLGDGDSLFNSSGTIIGGKGGQGGSGSDGTSGQAITASGGAYVTNSGTIIAGPSSNGLVDAIDFYNGNNTLEIDPGSQIIGKVVSSGGDTLALGGAGTGTFDVSAIGSNGEYEGFNNYSEVGLGIWYLTNTTTALTPWTVYGSGSVLINGTYYSSGGVLAITTDASLGAVSGPLTLDGGGLQAAASFASSRSIFLDSTYVVDGSYSYPTINTLDPNGNTMTLDGLISGTGGLTLNDSGGGTGTVVLNHNNSYQGGTTIDSGTLEIFADNNLGATSNGINLAGGELLTHGIGGFFTSNRDITIDNAGILAALNGTSAIYNGAIFGGTVTIGDGTNNGTIIFSNTATVTNSNDAVDVNLSTGASLTNNGTITGSTSLYNYTINGSDGVLAVTLGTNASLTNNGTIMGGSGGAGVSAYTVYGAPSSPVATLNGENGGNGGNGGSAVSLENGASLINYGEIEGGGGGQGGNIQTFGNPGNAGNGGTAVTLTSGASLVNYNAITGGSGGIGYSGTDFYSVNAANGGVGVALAADTRATNNGTITGGSSGYIVGSGIVYNGDGGTAVTLDTNSSLTNNNTIIGGSAIGTGTAVGSNQMGQAVAMNTGDTLTNNGSISGGGGQTLLFYGGETGDGGTITGQGNDTIINAGSITRLQGDMAISFTGHGNTLELYSTSQITGNVFSAGGGDTLELGGPTNGTFDASQIGIGQYEGFSNYVKSDSSTWTLT